MKYINIQVLRAIDEIKFRETKPFPWANPQGAIFDDKFAELSVTFPALSLFKKDFGTRRSYGQRLHDRWDLMLNSNPPLSKPWSEFIAELQGVEYRTELERIFGTPNFSLFMWWQYAVRGCSVSPHCDGRTKLGSQLFYFNTPADWKDEWGGSTIVLDDEGKFDCESAPEISDFPRRFESIILGNRSFVFMRTPHSWHAVDEIRAPSTAYRKIFTVIAHHKPTLFQRTLRKFGLASAVQ